MISRKIKGTLYGCCLVIALLFASFGENLFSSEGASALWCQAGSKYSSLDEVSEPYLAQLLDGFSIASFDNVVAARNSLFGEYVNYIARHWKYEKKSLGTLSREVLYLRGQVATDCGPLAFCFLALLREAGLLSGHRKLADAELMDYIGVLEGATKKSPGSRLLFERPIFDSSCTYRLGTADHPFGEVFTRHYFVRLPEGIYDPTYKCVVASPEDLGATLLRPERDDPQWLVGRDPRGHTRRVRRIKPSCYEWASDHSEDFSLKKASASSTERIPLRCQEYEF